MVERKEIASKAKWLHDQSSPMIQSGCARPITKVAGMGPKYRPSKEFARLPVHEEDITVGDDTAALPDRQTAAMTVAVACVSDRNGIDGDRAADPTDRLSGERQNALQERYAPWKVSPFVKELGYFLRSRNNDQVIDLEFARGANEIEADRDACARIPEEPWGRFDRQRKVNAETPNTVAVSTEKRPVKRPPADGEARPGAARACTDGALRLRSRGCGHAANGPQRRRRGRCRLPPRRRSPGARARPLASQRRAAGCRRRGARMAGSRRPRPARCNLIRSPNVFASRELRAKAGSPRSIRRSTSSAHSSASFRRRNVSLTYFPFRRTRARQDPEFSLGERRQTCALRVHLSGRTAA